MKVALSLAAAALASFAARPATPDPAQEATAQAVALYELLSFAPETTPDWDKVRALFLEEAAVVWRAAPDRMQAASLDGFLEVFANTARRPDLQASGLTEKVRGTRASSFGDTAHVEVWFEAFVPGHDETRNEGIDSFQLVRQPDGWKIASIVNERAFGGRSIPKERFE